MKEQEQKSAIAFEKLNSSFIRLQVDVAEVQKGTATMQAELKTHESRLKALEASLASGGSSKASAADFVPRHIVFKRWCAFEQKASHGMKRADVVVYVDRVKPLLSPRRQHHLSRRMLGCRA